MYKVGIFGGAFNPPHKGHFHIASAAVETLKLDKLLIVPTGVSPHKARGDVVFAERLEMCSLAFSGLEKAEISDIEGRIGGKSFTINTIRELRRRYPGDAVFYLIIGSDMLYSFTDWYKYESLLKESKVAAYARAEGEYTDMLETAAGIGHIKVLDIIALPMSSTEIREKIARGEDLSAHLSEAVINYIKEKNLYNFS